MAAVIWIIIHCGDRDCEMRLHPASSECIV